MVTDVPYEKNGRSRQKGRTRAALVAACRSLFDEGLTPTVEQAADRAQISRTTAYRYFRNQRELVIATLPELEQASLLGANPPADPESRLDIVLAEIAQQLLDHEATMRAALRVSLETPQRDQILRRGRAIRWIEDALSPLRDRLGKQGLHRLTLSIRAAFGIEPFVWLVDVGGLARRAAIELMQSSARTLLAAAVAASDGGGGARRR